MRQLRRRLLLLSALLFILCQQVEADESSTTPIIISTATIATTNISRVTLSSGTTVTVVPSIFSQPFPILHDSTTGRVKSGVIGLGTQTKPVGVVKTGYASVGTRILGHLPKAHHRAIQRRHPETRILCVVADLKSNMSSSGFEPDTLMALIYHTITNHHHQPPSPTTITTTTIAITTTINACNT
ncbi:hypothetical protein BZA05DRAFT_417899 [Tricharina praecox]|uniref:uncharacterized protein n=1 Tax=Tricharina praecox TaxID=43433 RepID=UPI00221EF598|nr:uncharacterized protein BZA05DRAFT_417899 [Tricharina praecox]KAI5853807.1 hypothetical protein BZA05DRAFT_417899 [Tricharina praecox]